MIIRLKKRKENLTKDETEPQNIYVKKEFRRLISINMFLKKGNQVKPSTYLLDTRRHLSSSLVYRKVLTVEMYSQKISICCMFRA